MKPNLGRRLLSPYLREVINHHVRHILQCDGPVIVHHMTDSAASLQVEVEYYINNTPNFGRITIKEQP